MTNPIPLPDSGNMDDAIKAVKAPMGRHHHQGEFETEIKSGHVYLSTSCWHGHHEYCQSDTGMNGAGEAWTKRAGQCKFCDARCFCECHLGEGTSPHAPGATPPSAQTAPARDTFEGTSFTSWEKIKEARRMQNE